ncbi:epoxyqueuosine reductase [Abyssisolibacter fermentans]|uniref:epoxyqueuosine reductase n=1 Tax=Abyssisolibacter fermentans TaxID=1766203 RepID=UPI000A673EAE|nr:epoxyqueuosine reductase [Abyssisolibacter fermentans]
MNNKMKEKLYEKAYDMGVAKIGVANLEGFLFDDLKQFSTGISIAVRLSDAIINQINDIPTKTYFHHYRAINFLIDQITLALSNMIQNEGYYALAIPASQTIKTDKDAYRGLFQHRTAAVRAGLGWIGKNACLITDEYGPRVRLGTILTNMTLEYDKPIVNSKCGDCNICVSKCPALALKGNLWKPGIEREKLVDVVACSNHMSVHYKDIGRGSVCGVCVSNCPKGNRVLR